MARRLDLERTAPSSGRKLFFFIEFERSGINAIAQIGRLGPIIENMAQVGIALGAQCFGAAHEKTVVFLGLDVFCSDRRPEAGPACARIEFRVRAKQLVAAAGASVNAL